MKTVQILHNFFSEVRTKNWLCELLIVCSCWCEPNLFSLVSCPSDSFSFDSSIIFLSELQFKYSRGCARSSAAAFTCTVAGVGWRRPSRTTSGNTASRSAERCASTWLSDLHATFETYLASYWSEQFPFGDHSKPLVGMGSYSKCPGLRWERYDLDLWMFFDRRALNCAGSSCCWDCPVHRGCTLRTQGLLACLWQQFPSNIFCLCFSLLAWISVGTF